MTRITIVSNNYGPGGGSAAEGERIESAGGLVATWGFAAVIETPDGRLLFDVGADGPALLANMEALGLDPEDLAAVTFSHEHWDHTGGIEEALAATSGACRVYMPGVFPDELKDKVRSSGRGLVETGGPVEMLPGVTTTRVVGGPADEQAVAVDDGGAGAVVTGCAHPGAGAMARAAAEATGRAPELILGGLHMFPLAEEEIRAAARELRSLGISRVAPTHCTGDLGRRIFAAEWGAGCIRADLGDSVDVGG